MKHLLKNTVFTFAFILCTSAHASMECAGQDASGKYVQVSIDTDVKTSRAKNGMVTIYDGNHKYGYAIDSSSIAQYYENDLFGTTETLVGMKASVDGTAPVELLYAGTNFADQDLVEVLKKKGGVASKMNYMVVWKGPNTPATEQFVLSSIVCGVWAN
ncbi:MAG: hypothetical protein KDD22_05165 [Bdellovibrionales bacterium]|nr:hypothetical protein [Bdellovibrionales bacterium]